MSMHAECRTLNCGTVKRDKMIPEFEKSIKSDIVCILSCSSKGWAGHDFNHI